MGEEEGDMRQKGAAGVESRGNPVPESDRRIEEVRARAAVADNGGEEGEAYGEAVEL